MPLPLILEQTSRWYYFAVPLSGLLVFGVARWAYQGFRAGWVGGNSLSFVAAPALLMLAVWFVMMPNGWSFRLDRDGITLAAPLDPFEQAGTIAWSDLRDIRFGRTGGRHTYPTLEFVGTAGTVVTLATLDGVPASYWPALVAAIEANASAFRFRPDSQAWLARLIVEAQPGELTTHVRGYRAHDGNGRELP